MPQFPDFSPLDATIQERTLCWDFSALIPGGIILTGTPNLTMSVVTGDDPNPSSHILSGPIIGTAPSGMVNNVPIPAGTPNCAVFAKIGMVNPNVRYKFTIYCNQTDGDIASGFNNIDGVNPF